MVIPSSSTTKIFSKTIASMYNFYYVNEIHFNLADFNDIISLYRNFVENHPTLKLVGLIGCADLWAVINETAKYPNIVVSCLAIINSAKWF